MSKHGGYLTPKAIANRMKAKGLQKLRWYCQMCKKQCRDENGFKCHKATEGHQRMMKIFRENRGSILDKFSKEFEKGFMDLVRRRWRSKRVFANKVYNEYISDRHHLHMNATIWSSLAGFVKHLGRTKQCEVDETEKGWYIKYIDKDADALAQQDSQKKKEKMELDEELRVRKRIEKIISENESNPEKATSSEPTELKRVDEEEKIVFKLAGTPSPVINPPLAIAPIKAIFKEDDEDEEEEEEEVQIYEGKKRKWEDEEDYGGSKKAKRVEPTTALDELTTSIMKQQTRRESIKKRNEERYKETKSKEDPPEEPSSPVAEDQGDNWLVPGLIVKVMNRKVGGGAFYGKKGQVMEVIDLYVGVIKMLESPHKLKVDQEHLETVIPAIGSEIGIVKGEYRGEAGILEEIRVDKYKVVVRVNDTFVEKEYEEVCKITAAEE